MSEPIKPEVSVFTEDYEVKAGGYFYHTDFRFYPIAIAICLSIHKSCKDQPLLTEILKRSFKVASINLDDPDKPEIVLEEVGPRSGIVGNSNAKLAEEIKELMSIIKALRNDLAYYERQQS